MIDSFSIQIEPIQSTQPQNGSRMMIAPRVLYSFRSPKKDQDIKVKKPDTNNKD